MPRALRNEGGGLSLYDSFRRELIMARRMAERVRARLPSRERRLERRFDALRERYFRAWWEEVAGALGAEIDSVGYGFHRLRRAGKSTFVRRGEVMLDDHLTLAIAGNKPLVHRLLQEQGHEVPDFLEYELSEIGRALALIRREGGDFVVKPAAGGAGGRGITTKVNSRARLLEASWNAAAHGSGARLIIEREYGGDNYRLLYLDGHFLDAVRRESPAVTGDGRHSIRQLVALENRRRLEGAATLALSPLTLDLDARYTLSDQGLSLAYVPAPGERVRVKTATNQCSRLENHRVRDEVHPAIVDHGRQLSRAIGVRLSGVDMMLRDHRVPLEQSGCVVNEINTTPGLHHHGLVSAAGSAGIEVGARIIDYLFDRQA